MNEAMTPVPRSVGHTHPRNLSEELDNGDACRKKPANSDPASHRATNSALADTPFADPASGQSRPVGGGPDNLDSGATGSRNIAAGGAVAGNSVQCGTATPRPARVPLQCGDLPFLIRRDGTWLYRGSPIGRKELVCLFASILRRDEEGAWWLRTPAEHGRIEVEDAPFLAVELDWTGDGRQQILSFRTNIDEVVTAGVDHPIRVSHDLLTCEPTPYILLRPGDGRHGIEARVNRAVYYELVALAVPEYVGPHLMLGVWSSGQFFPLGFMPDEDGDDEL